MALILFNLNRLRGHTLSKHEISEIVYIIKVYKLTKKKGFQLTLDHNCTRRKMVNSDRKREHIRPLMTLPTPSEMNARVCKVKKCSTQIGS